MSEPAEKLNIRAIVPLLFAAAILLAGNGVLSTLIALRSKLEGFDTALVGLMGTSYFIGFFIASFYGAVLIRSIGHIRAFAALAAIGALVPLSMAMLVDAWVWVAIRAISGFTFGALLMVIESWINETSRNASRGRVLSIYRIVDLLAVISAQFLIPLVGEGGFEIFSVVGILYCLSLLPVAISNRTRPKPLEKLKLKLGVIWKISPLACMSCLAIGLTNSAFMLVGPIYAVEIGLGTTQVIIFIAVGVLGGAVAQYPFGALSDKLGRRKSALVATIGAVLAAMFLSAQGGESKPIMYLGSFGFGAFALPLYSLAVAHANDRASAGQYVLVAAGITFFFALGAGVGPYIASVVIKYFGAAYFFVYTSVVHGTLGLVVLLRLQRRASVPAEQRSKFVGVLKTSPVFFRMTRKISQRKE